MNDNRDHDQRAGADDQELGAALGEAVGREAGSPVTPPPVTDIAERAAARARARRVRHGVVGIAAAAALVAGLVTWNTLDGDGGDGNIQVATQPTVSEPTAPEQAAPPAGEVDPGDGESAGGDTGGAAPATPQPPAPPADPGRAAEDPAGDSSEGMPDFLTPEGLSTGPTLEWIEVSADLDTNLDELGEMISLGDGRIISRDHSFGGERILITGDGLTWRPVEPPEGLSITDIDLDGDSWVIAGRDPKDADDPGRVLVSGDGGSTWTEQTLDLEPPEGLPQHCSEQSAVTDVMISGDRVVALVASRRILDTAAVLVERGLIDEGTLAHEFHRSGDTIVFRLGHPDEWDFDDEDDLLRVDLEDLGLSEDQFRECDDLYDGVVRVFAGGGSGLEEVAEYQGWADNGVATRDGFAFGLLTAGDSAWVTSSDGRTWSRLLDPEAGMGPMARGPDGSLWLAGDHTGLRIRRGDVNSAPETVATFEPLQPVGVVAAGPAGVATAAWALPQEIWDFMAPSFSKDGYELQFGEPDGGVSLWNLAEGTAVHEFSAEEMEADEFPEGVREVIEDDGSTTVVFSDPETGEDLVAFTAEDLTPDTEGLVETRLEMFGPTGQPPIWIGWSADGSGWGWQDATEAFGLGDDEGLSPVDLAVGTDFVLARFVTFDLDEISRAGAAADPTPPMSLRTRWFIARMP